MHRGFIGLAAAVILLFLTLPLYGLDVSITGKELGIDFQPEYNRLYNQCLTFSVSGSLEFNERHTLKGVIALWNASALYEISSSLGFETKVTRKLPLYASLFFMINNLPDYESHSYTVLPLIGFRGRYAGITLGTNLRFSSFFDEPVLFESVLAFDGYVNFYNTEKFRIGLRCANFNDFSAGNFGAYYISLNTRLGISGLFSLVNDLELHQTGSAGLTAEFLSIVYKLGVVFTW